VIGFVQDTPDLKIDAQGPTTFGRGQVTEPALNRGWLLAVMLLFFVGYLLQYPILVLTGIFFTVFRFGAHWYGRRALKGVEYSRDFSLRRTFPDEETIMTVRVANQKRLPLSWLAAVDHWAEELPLTTSDGRPLPQRPADLVTLLFSLRGNEQLGRSYRIRPERRGIYPFGPVALSAGDPFGLFTIQTRFGRRDWLVVYPRLVPLDGLELPYQAPFGDVSVRQSIFQDPVRTVGVRDYRPSDSFRHVHWKASARRQNLQVRVFEPTTAHTLILMLNVATFARYWEGTRPEILERLVSATASIANYAIDQHWLAGLTANGAMPNADQPIRVPPGRGPDQLSFLLEALAGVTSFTTAPFERFLLQESSRLAWGATLVIVTAVVTDEILASLERLRDAGRRIVLVALTVEPPDLPPGLLAYHAPNEGLAFEPGQARGKVRLISLSYEHPQASIVRRPSYAVLKPRGGLEQEEMGEGRHLRSAALERLP
jgi:uncharacterized protein (DUF58 family)